FQVDVSQQIEKLAKREHSPSFKVRQRVGDRFNGHQDETGINRDG
ncbi:28031_t:CDS:1, partial [Racocetra persica]